jgi:ribosomal-protein-alanine N-acetyltransferase
MRLHLLAQVLPLALLSKEPSVCLSIFMESIVIETPRLHLRRMTLDDVPALLSVFGDPEVMRFYPAPFDEARMQRWVAWNQNHYTEHGHGLWTVILRATGECIGDCGLVPQQVEGVPEIEIGYHLRRDLWGQGLATEAALGCLNHGLTTFGYRRFVSLIHPQNTASRRVAEKVGMTLEREVEWKNKPTCVYAVERPAT